MRHVGFMLLGFLSFYGLMWPAIGFWGFTDHHIHWEFVRVGFVALPLAILIGLILFATRRRA